jgi:AcrR family transcriptional regulator
MTTAEPSEMRERILAATYERVAADGLARTTVESVAQSGTVSRATIYRHFPGGRDELIQAVVSWEVGRFFDKLAEDTADATDFTDWLAQTLLSARHRLVEHEVLQHAFALEADQLVPPMLTVMPIALGMLREQIAERLAREELRPGVDLDEAADLLARLLVSFIGTPGSWNLDDPEQLDRLVRGQLLAGVLAS